MISGSTALIGLLGDPVEHSLSPTMQNAALAAMNLNWCYLAMPCKTNDLSKALQGLRALNCLGLNITIPHKKSVAKLCDELSPIARKLGAVNTLIPNKNGGWTGENTDVEGFLYPLKNNKKNWQHLQAIVIGCGGSAKAVVAGLEELKLAEITIIGRNKESLESFTKNEAKNIYISRNNTIRTKINICVIKETNLINLIQKVDLIVNTTPVGMLQKNITSIKEMPLGNEIWQHLKPQTTLYDLIYTPRPTYWLEWGQKEGFECINGLEMLLQQGAASLRLWSGINKLPIEVMRKALETSLKN